MKLSILILSDTHSFLDQRTLDYAMECDEVWHAGDIGDIGVLEKLEKVKKLRIVHGNIDDHLVRSECPENLIFETGGVKVFITHIAGYPKKYTARVQSILKLERPDVVVCGHSHILKVLYDHDFGHLHINPGAVGVHGFHQVRTLIRLEINNGKPANLDVIELNGKKAEDNLIVI